MPARAIAIDSLRASANASACSSVMGPVGTAGVWPDAVAAAQHISQAKKPHVMWLNCRLCISSFSLEADEGICSQP